MYDSPAGWKDYSRRVDFMLEREQGKCCLCGKWLHRRDATFEHQRRRDLPPLFGWTRFLTGKAAK